MVSIICCTYNDSNTLPRALRSCLYQDIEKEIIIVDDGSTVPLIEEVNDLIKDNKEIKLIRHKENGGLSKARNTGISHSKYSLNIVLDADDYFFPNSVKVLFENVDDENAVFYGNVLSQGTICLPKKFPFKREEILVDNPVFCSSLFKKEMWKDIGGYKVRKGSHYEDWNFWLRALIKGYKFKYIETLVYEHVERENSMLRELAKNKQFYVDVATEELRNSDYGK